MDAQKPQTIQETKMLARAREFDQEALTWVYETYHDAIYRYIYHHIGSVQTAQDITSDVFRRFLQAVRNGGGPTQQLSAWLYRVAHNLFVDELRRRQHRDYEPLDSPQGLALKDSSASPAELADLAIAQGQVRQALLELTDDQRDVIILKFVEGMSNAQIAEITGKTLGAVKSLQHRGLATLRDAIKADQKRTSSLAPQHKMILRPVS